ncbi:MAG: endonuclease III [Ignavibacteriae bacterium]|nr:endonuclease III [Ignavibacteriota bacterium]MCB9214302.1 endonuclease III [Ignavibacteria bacterium]
MPESPTATRKRAVKIIALLEETYSEAKIALHYNSPFQLLIATILSAQCTDERVNSVTPGLFEHYPTPQDFLAAPVEELEQAIFSTGFYRNKAKSIRGACEALITEHGREVPRTMEELITLPGVGRKTANVLLGHCFGVPGLVVDTHVKRISNLLRLADSQNPDVIEKQLEEVVPKEKWVKFSHLLAEHGRAICIARRPKCPECPVVLLCPSAQT